MSTRARAGFTLGVLLGVGIALGVLCVVVGTPLPWAPIMVGALLALVVYWVRAR